MSNELLELLKLFAAPEQYAIQLIDCEGRISSVKSINSGADFCREDRFLSAVLTEERGFCRNYMNLSLPFDDESDLYARSLLTEILSRRLPLLSYYERCRIKAIKRGERSQPMLFDAFIQRLPCGEFLRDYIDGATPHMIDLLVKSVANLEAEIRRCDLEFQKLRVSDLILGDDDRLYPFRYESLRFDHKRSVCEPLEECEALRREVDAMCDFSIDWSKFEPEAVPYSDTLCDIYCGHLSSRAPREGLLAVEDNEGWGFVDLENRLVIKPQYLRVSDFAGGRAVVQMVDTELFGVIDREGNYIYEPKYCRIEFDEVSGEIIRAES